MPVLVSKSLRDGRRVLIGWTAGISAFLGIYLSVYPNIAREPQFYGQAGVAKFPGPLRDLMGGLNDFVSGVGYLHTLVYQLFGPLLFTMCAAVLTNRALAQPEESGTLELTLTLPLDRKRLVLERFAGFALGLLIVAVVTFLLVWGASSAAGMDVPLDRILAAHTGVYLLALLLGTIGFAVGAAVGRKGPALAAIGVVGVGGYVLETLGANVSAIAWLRWLSPFHYYLDGRPLYQGFPWGDYLVLLGVTAVLLMSAVLAFDRRDVGV